MVLCGLAAYEAHMVYLVVGHKCKEQSLWYIENNKINISKHLSIAQNLWTWSLELL